MCLANPNIIKRQGEGEQLTSVKVILLRDDLSPVLGTFSRQLLRLVQSADGQGLDVFLEGFFIHLLYSLLHGAKESLHSALQVVGRLLRLDDEAQALYAVGPPGPAEHNVALGAEGTHRQVLSYTYRFWTEQQQQFITKCKLKRSYNNYSNPQTGSFASCTHPAVLWFSVCWSRARRWSGRTTRAACCHGWSAFLSGSRSQRRSCCAPRFAAGKQTSHLRGEGSFIKGGDVELDTKQYETWKLPMWIKNKQDYYSCLWNCQ